MSYIRALCSTTIKVEKSYLLKTQNDQLNDKNLEKSTEFIQSSEFNRVHSREFRIIVDLAIRKALLCQLPYSSSDIKNGIVTISVVMLPCRRVRSKPASYLLH